jgi:hypothetical protein
MHCAAVRCGALINLHSATASFEGKLHYVSQLTPRCMLAALLRMLALLRMMALLRMLLSNQAGSLRIRCLDLLVAVRTQLYHELHVALLLQQRLVQRRWLICMKLELAWRDRGWDDHQLLQVAPLLQQRLVQRR